MAFTAILSRIFLKRGISLQQWISIGLILVGLWVSALPSFYNNPETPFIGILITLTGTILYSIAYILNEKILFDQKHITPEEYCAYLGFACLIITLGYIVIFTIPNWDRIVTTRIKENSGYIPGILICYMLLILAGFAHNFSYFKILKSFGAVTTGVMQAFRAISVFALSALLFCSKDVAQCYTVHKAIATIMVSLGIILFASSKNNNKY